MKSSPKSDENIKPDAPALKGEEVSSLSESNFGDIKIHDDVILSLTKSAVLSVNGVAHLAGTSLFGSLAELVGSSRATSRAISVTVGDGNQISLCIKVVLLVGYRIPEVAEKIQKAVIRAVNGATGMEVCSVQILVQDIEDQRSAEEKNAD